MAMEQLTVWDYLIQTKHPSRKILMDAIKRLEVYAIRSGSKNHKWYYATFTRLIRKASGEDEMLYTELNLCIADLIKVCITVGIPYTEIYELCKEKIEEVMSERNHLAESG